MSQTPLSPMPTFASNLISTLSLSLSFFGVGRVVSASRHSTSGADRFVVISSSSPYPWPYPYP